MRRLGCSTWPDGETPAHRIVTGTNTAASCDFVVQPSCSSTLQRHTVQLKDDIRSESARRAQG